MASNADSSAPKKRLSLDERDAIIAYVRPWLTAIGVTNLLALLAGIGYVMFVLPDRAARDALAIYAEQSKTLQEQVIDLSVKSIQTVARTESSVNDLLTRTSELTDSITKAEHDHNSLTNGITELNSGVIKLKDSVASAESQLTSELTSLSGEVQRLEERAKNLEANIETIGDEEAIARAAKLVQKLETLATSDEVGLIKVLIDDCLESKLPQRLTIGRTQPASDEWVEWPLGGDRAISIWVDTQQAGLRSDGTPLYLTAIGGDGGHFGIRGLTSIYEAKNNGFRIVAYDDVHSAADLRQIAIDENWHIIWCATTEIDE